MQNSEFEKSVQRKMGDLNIPPSGDLWEKIEAKLPAEKKPRRWLLFILICVVFSGSSLLLWDNLIPANDYNRDKKDSTSEPIVHTILPAPTGKNALPFLPAEVPAEKDKTLKQPITIVEKKADQSLPPDKKSRTTLATGITGPGYDPLKKRNLIQLDDPIKNRMKTKAPAVEPGDDTTAVSTAITSAPVNAISTNPVPSIININEERNNKTDSLQEKPMDSTTVIQDPASVKKKNAKGWKYGLHAGAGFSYVKTGLFNGTALFADTQGNNYNSPGGSTGSPTVAAPNSPESSTSFSTGLFIQKTLHTKLTFYTGLQYGYQSNTLKVSKAVDSVTRRYSFASGDIRANRFYTTGNAVSYKNRFHMIEMPLLLQYNVSKKWPLHLDIGAIAAYLVGSNALVYHGNSRAYLTDEAMFNNFLLSLAGGAGIDLAKKSRLPFSIGYRFSYSISSATKEAYGRQHLLNSLFYLDVPLKK